MAVLQYTCTHKQYTEQHNETEYLEQHIGNNNNNNIIIHKHNKNTKHNYKNTQIYKSKQKRTKHTTIYTIIQNITKIKMKMSMYHWWNDTDRGKQKYSEINL